MCEASPQKANDFEIKLQLEEKVEGDSFSSEDEKFQISHTYDLSESLFVRKRSYRFMSIIEDRNITKKKKLQFNIPSLETNDTKKNIPMAFTPKAQTVGLEVK